ncbi:MAG: oligosaccharide flippase family protein [Lachnospira sp.]
MKHFYNNPILKGTVILTAASILCRLMGFFYRIYLNKCIGAAGIGIIQLLSPLMGIAYAVCCSGFGLAISKFTARDYKKKPAYYWLITGLCLSFPVSVIFSAIVIQNAGFIASRLLFNPQCMDFIKIIAFSIPLSSVHHCICGYYYGLRKANVPAISQIIEQGVRIAAIYIYFSAFDSITHDKGISYALLGNIWGEGFACIYCFILMYINKEKNNNKKMNYSKNAMAELIIYSLPVNLNTLLTHILESGEAVLIPLTLTMYGMTDNTALSVYGIISGMCLPLIMFPASIANSMSTMLLPKISYAKEINNESEIISSVNGAVQSCIHIGLFCTFFFIIAGSRIGAFLFDQPEVYTYTCILAWLCPFLYLKIIFSGIINGLGMTKKTCFANVTASVIRIIFIIIFSPKIGIRGYLYSLLLSNIFSCAYMYLTIKKMYRITLNPLEFYLLMYDRFNLKD